MISIARLRRHSRRLQEMHRPLLATMLALAGLGLLMQYSAAGGNVQPFMIPQLVRFFLGACAFVVLVCMQTQTLMRLSYLAYGACVLLLVIVEAVGIIGGGAQRWVSVGVFNLQPSEFMKIGVILALAHYFHHATLEGTRHFFVLLIPAMLTGVPVILILLQPNLGTATIIGMIAFSMCFMAGIRWFYFAGVLGAGAAAIPVIYHFLHDYQKQRVQTFLNPESDPLGAGYNIIQSKIAIGSGGFFGKGLTQGSQGQLDFLPEKQTDFIFTMLAEELGFAGVICLLIGYGIVLFFALRLAATCRHGFGRMLAAGVAALIFFHALINIAMVMGLIPVVGVPLPFLSYGGSFLITILVACGLLMHVYVNRDLQLARSSRF
jgi:rod shape determining protein RodA